MLKKKKNFGIRFNFFFFFLIFNIKVEVINLYIINGTK